MAKLTIPQLEQATSIPQGSSFIVDMGDGSGTKRVTKETLAEETGKALKVGDLEELHTENKESLVAAINEAAQSGGGGASVEVDILDSKEEIEANTETGKAAGALAVQEMFSELNDKLQGFEPVIDPETGQITGYKTTAGGADTVFPFRKNPIFIGRISNAKNELSVTHIPGYKALTIDSFVYKNIKAASIGGGYATPITFNNSIAYDSTNGKIQANSLYAHKEVNGQSNTFSLEFDVYLVI